MISRPINCSLSSSFRVFAMVGGSRSISDQNCASISPSIQIWVMASASRVLELLNVGRFTPPTITPLTAGFNLAPLHERQGSSVMYDRSRFRVRSLVVSVNVLSSLPNTPSQGRYIWYDDPFLLMNSYCIDVEPLPHNKISLASSSKS